MNQRHMAGCWQLYKTCKTQSTHTGPCLLLQEMSPTSSTGRYPSVHDNICRQKVQSRQQSYGHCTQTNRAEYVIQSSHSLLLTRNDHKCDAGAELMRLTLGSWSQDRDMTMVGTLYCTYMTSWVGSTAAITSQRGFIREEVVNFRSAAQQHQQQQSVGSHSGSRVFR